VDTVVRKLSTIEKNALKTKLFLSNARSQERSPKPRKKKFPGFETRFFFCNSETKNDKRTAPRPKLICIDKITEAKAATTKMY
jgi:hypothetical protein